MHTSVIGLIRVAAILVFLIVTSLLGACSTDNPVEAEEEHFEPVGLVLRANDSDLVRYENGVVNGAIELTVGATPSQITVMFILEDGNIVAADEDDLSLAVEVADTAVAGIDDPVSDDWGFALQGVTEGATSLVVRTLHNGHTDFQTKPISVVVKP